MVTAVETVKHALAGGELDTAVLEKLSYDPYRADELRDELVPLLAQLLASHPEKAAQVPESLVNVLLRKMSLREVLESTGLSAESLSNPVVRPILLHQLVLKTKGVEEQALTQELLKQAFALFTDAELESVSVAEIEKLVGIVPQAARRYLPVAELHAGTAIQKARLMELNVQLLGAGVVPDLDYLAWPAFTTEEEDLLLAALQVDYVGQLLDYFITRPEIQKVVQRSLYTITVMYKPETLIANSIEATLAKTCRRVESLFLELDAQFLLVTKDRIALLARLPAHYIVKHHLEIIEELELSTRTLPAVANIARDFDGLRQLHIPQGRLLNMTITSQLLVTTAAMSTAEGADYFENKYSDVLRNAVTAPVTEDTRDLKVELELNMRLFGKNWSTNNPSVATRPA